MIEIGGQTGTLFLLVPFSILLLTVVACLRTSKAILKIDPCGEPEVPAARYRLVAVDGDAGSLARADERRADAADIPAVPWVEQIRLAEARKDFSALPALYLSLGREEIARGNSDDGAGHLRACIRTAARPRNLGAEAEARLELAELARVSGDLTTACEHWQIARSLFHKLQSAADLADTEDRMQRHGCPTDWVLTDF